MSSLAPEQPTCTLQAEAIVATPERIIDHGELVIRAGVVERIQEGWSTPGALRLEGQAILPGIINCHTHLEFSYLPKPIHVGENFPEWISNVVAARRTLENRFSAVELQAFRKAAIVKGIEQLSCAGTAVACDIATPPWNVPDWSPSSPDLPVSIVPMGEVIGLDDERLCGTFQWAESLSHAWAKQTQLPTGISPHSPYSVKFDCLAALFDRLPKSFVVAMHLAESRDEMIWLDQRRGPFAAAFERIGVSPPEALPTIEQCLALLSPFERGLVVHGNYLNEDDLKFLAERPNLSLVVCPRTHGYFGHDKFPVDAALRAGVRVVLGTDSMASNPDLSIWLEMSELRRKLPGLSPASVFAMATSHAAEALGLESKFGRIQNGVSVGTLLSVDCSSVAPKDLLDHLTQLSQSPAASSLEFVIRSNDE